MTKYQTRVSKAAHDVIKRRIEVVKEYQQLLSAKTPEAAARRYLATKYQVSPMTIWRYVNGVLIV